MKVDLKEFESYTKIMAKMPKIIRPAISATLNKQAGSMKFEHIPEALEDSFEIRSKAFMNRQVRFKNSKRFGDPATNFSEAGSVEKDDFTGWEEQQTGEAPEKQRTATHEARGGSFQKRQRPKSRLKRSNTFLKPSDFNGKTKKKRLIQTLIASKTRKKYFIVTNKDGRIKKRFKPGVYGFKGDKLFMMQSFKKVKGNKKDWMGLAIDKLENKQGDFTKIYGKELNRIFRGMK